MKALRAPRRRVSSGCPSITVVSQFTGSVQGNTALQTQEPKRRLEMPMVAHFAEAALSNVSGNGTV
jgi:hypothetical protein